MEALSEGATSQTYPAPPEAQCLEVQELYTQNNITGSRDTNLQTQTVKDAWQEQYGTPPPSTSDTPQLPDATRYNNHFATDTNLEADLLAQLRSIPGVELDVPDNPVNVFVTPHEGNSATTRITGTYVVKGYVDHAQADVEWLGTRFMQLSGEITPDIHRASLPLREQIMAVDPDFKMPDRSEKIKDPAFERLSALERFGKKEPERVTIPVNAPQHCLVMPKLNASNLGNIVEDPGLRASFSKSIKRHSQEMARMAFKDILLNINDRVIRMHTIDDSPPYLPPQEENERGSPMNTGNIMFQTVNGEVRVGTGFAIDNWGVFRNNLKEKEGRAKELGVFEFYMEDVKASIEGGSEAGSPPDHHLVNRIMTSLKGALDSPELVLGEKAPPLYSMSDDDLRATVIIGLKRGWSEVVKNKAALQTFLESTAEEDEMETTFGQGVRSILLQKVEIAERMFNEAGFQS